MSHGVTILGRIEGAGSGDTPDTIGFSVIYDVKDNATPSGNIVVNVPKISTDQEMESEIRSKVAEHVANITGQPFDETDVRGCKI